MDGDEEVEQKPIPPGSRINGGRYVVKGLLGKGVFGRAFLVEDASGAKFVAKALNSDVDEVVKTREVDILKSLRHPNIIRYYGSFTEDDILFIITEFATGQPSSLADLVRAQGRLSEADVLPIFWQLSSALAYCHKEHGWHGKVIHRDIKPENVLLMADGSVRLVDFGLSRFMTADDVSHGMTMAGTELYAAPEVLLQYNYDESVDVYSLGCTILALLTGTAPIRPIRWPSGLSQALMEILSRMCKSRAEERCTMEDVFHAPVFQTLRDIQCQVTWKVVLLGDRSVGKSCLARRLNGEAFSPMSPATVGGNLSDVRIQGAHDGREFRVSLLDTAGSERYRAMAPFVLSGATFALVCYDASQPATIEAALTWAITAREHSQSIRLILVACKCDLVAAVSDREVARLREEVHADVFVATSSKTGEGLESLRDQLGQLIERSLAQRQGLTLTSDRAEPGRKNCC